MFISKKKWEDTQKKNTIVGCTGIGLGGAGLILAATGVISEKKDVKEINNRISLIEAHQSKLESILAESSDEAIDKKINKLNRSLKDFNQSTEESINTLNNKVDELNKRFNSVNANVITPMKESMLANGLIK